MPGTILVVDDSAVYLHVARLILERAGYRVLVARSGREAIELAQATLPDLITCDIIMPETDGLVTLGELKADPRTRDIPVYMLSATGEQAALNEALATGAAGYLSKPFSSTSLLGLVHRALRGEE